MSCCIAIGFFELPGLAGGFRYTKSTFGQTKGASFYFSASLSSRRLRKYIIRSAKTITKFRQ